MRDDGVVLTNLLAERAAKTPDRVFLLDTDGNELTYAQLHDRILRWAAALRAEGVRARRHRRHHAARRPRGLRHLARHRVAARHRGAAQLRVPRAHARAHGQHVRRPAGGRQRRVHAAVRRGAVGARRRSSASSCPTAPTPASPTSSPPPTSSRAAYHDIACMIYTSGTTGPSKGVLMPWGELHQFVTAAARRHHRRRTARYYLCLPGVPRVGEVGHLHLRRTTTPGSSSARRSASPSFWSDVRALRRARRPASSARWPASSWPCPSSPTTPTTRSSNVSMGPLVAEVEEFKRRFGVEVVDRLRHDRDRRAAGVGRLEPGQRHVVRQAAHRATRATRCGSSTSIDRARSAPTRSASSSCARAEPWAMNAGYYNMPDETAEAWRNGWFHTGDAFRTTTTATTTSSTASRTPSAGGARTSRRSRSRRYVTQHPAVAECAAVGGAVRARRGRGQGRRRARGRRDELDPEELIEFLDPDACPGS